MCTRLPTPRLIALFASLVLLLSAMDARAGQSASEALPIAAADSWLYGTDGVAIYKISPDTAEVLQIGETEGRRSVGDIAVTPAGTIFLAGRSLLRLDGNGVARLVDQVNGISGLTVEALGSDSQGRLFGSAFYRLFEVQPATAQARVLASLDINPSDMAFGPDGNLYAVIGPTVTGNTDRLIRISPLTGQAILVGNIGFRSVDGIAFGPDGRLYGAANAATLIAINPATGAGSAIGVFSNFREMVGLGSAPPLTITAPAPTNLRATVNGSTLALAWDGVPGATYVLEAGSAPGLANLFNGNVGGATSLTTSAPPGTYYLRVRSLAGASVSGASNEIVVTTPGTSGGGTCVAPSGLTASVSAAIITIRWNGPPGATSYQMEAGTASGLANVFNGNVGPTTVIQFNRAGIPSGVYFLRVKAVASCGTSAASNELILDLR
jgi:hypothetical protein